MRISLERLMMFPLYNTRICPGIAMKNAGRRMNAEEEAQMALLSSDVPRDMDED